MYTSETQQVDVERKYKVESADEEVVEIIPYDDQDAKESANDITGGRPLSRPEIWNLCFALLAWACTISNVTLVVGSSAVVILSLGADDSIASVPLGAFFIGSSLVSLSVSPWLFAAWGRQRGFLVSIAFGLLGTSLGCTAVVIESPLLVIVASFFFGVATGVGFSWRFAVVETVPSHWAARAVTLVVSGGCIASFAPETARGTRNRIGDVEEEPHLEYLGVYVMTGVFNALNLIFTLLVSFPKRNNDQQQAAEQGDTRRLGALLKSRQFLVPVSCAGLSWAIMAIPMSVLTVAMRQVGFSSRQSLSVIELHFLSMYAPGLITGHFLQRYGPRRICASAAILSAAAPACIISANPNENDSGINIFLWILGMVLVGVGWNWGFTGATVWLTELYQRDPQLKEKIQAANDSCMFCFAGGFIFSASYIFNSGGSGLEGWRLLNKIVIGLLACYAGILLANFHLERRSQKADVDLNCTET